MVGVIIEVVGGVRDVVEAVGDVKGALGERKFSPIVSRGVLTNSRITFSNETLRMRGIVKILLESFVELLEVVKSTLDGRKFFQGVLDERKSSLDVLEAL